MASPRSTWLVTGFPSWIARAVAREVAREEDGSLVHLLVPEDRAAEAAEFCRSLRGLASIVRPLAGDAVRMDLGLPGRDYMALARDVDILVNLYDVGPLPETGAGGYGGLYGRLGDVTQLTVRAVQEMLEFAAVAGPRLRHVLQLGSLTVAGAHAGVWTEDDLSAGQRLRTNAERARHRAERLLWRVRDRVPFTIVRVGPVLGDSRTGEIGWYHGPHDLLEALLASPPPSAWPQRVSGPAALHTVPSDHLARMLRALAGDRPERSGAIHVAPPVPLPVSQILETLGSGGPPLRLPRTIAARVRKRYGSGAAAAARSFARIDTRASCSTRRARDVERAAGIVQPRAVDLLPVLAARLRTRLAAEAQRLAEAGVEDALDG